jgi:DNA polymerase III subunit epsilon
MNMNNFVVLDTETTGLYDSPEPVQISIINQDGLVLLDSFVRPVRHSIWPEAERIHGISPDMVSNAPTLLDLKNSVESSVFGADLIIYNASYDLPIVFGDGISSTFNHVFCCMLAYCDYANTSRWQKLVSAAQQTGYVWPKSHQPHSALGDCFATLHIWRTINGLV